MKGRKDLLELSYLLVSQFGCNSDPDKLMLCMLQGTAADPEGFHACAVSIVKII